MGSPNVVCKEEGWNIDLFISVIILQGFHTLPLPWSRGKSVVAFSQEEIVKLVSTFKHALVGKFSHGRPSMDQLRKAFASIDFSGSYSLGISDHRYVLIRFTQEDDFYHCLLKGLWMIQEFPMRVFIWSLEFWLDVESSHALVLVSFETLPILFFNNVGLFTIVNAIGVPLKIDSATTILSRPNVVRFCVELDVCKELPRRIWISMADGGFWQNVTYEEIPHYCVNYHKQGHDICS